MGLPGRHVYGVVVNHNARSDASVILENQEEWERRVGDLMMSDLSVLAGDVGDTQERLLSGS
jgi:hypothetical protein